MSKESHEISEIKNLLSRAEIKNEVFETYLGMTDEMVAIFDPKGEMLVCNKGLVDSLGANSEADLQGKKLFEIIDEEVAERRKTYLYKCVNESEKIEFFDSRDGRDFYNRYYPVGDGNVLMIGRDITAINKAKKALEQSERDKAMILDNMEEIVSFKDKDMRYSLVNRACAESAESSPEEMIGRHCYELCYGNDVPCKGCVVLETLKTGVIKEGEIETPDGKIWHTRGYPVFNEAGKITGVVDVSMDITEKKNIQKEKESLEKRLLQSQKMEIVGKIAGGVAHDLNNMLQIISGNAQLGLSEIKNGDPGHDEFKEILDATNRAGELSMKLTALGRKDNLEIREMLVDDVVLDLASTLSSKLPDSIKIELSLSELGHRVKADIVRIRQALTNICENAVDSMPGGGTLRIETSLNSPESENDGFNEQDKISYSRIRIADNGEGMSKDIENKIFDPFFTTRNTKDKSGLGMPVALGIINNHNGLIQVESKAGEGTVVDVFLPVVLARENGLRKKETFISGNEKILVVDDEDAILRLTSRMLKTEGFNVETASDGSEALEIFRADAENIPLVVLDIIMPGLDGKKVADELKKISPDIKIIFCSGFSKDEVIHDFEANSSMDFIYKPFDTSLLINKIKSLLSH